MDKTIMGNFSILSKLIPAILRESFFNNNRQAPAVTHDESSDKNEFPDIPKWTTEAWVKLTIRQRLGGSFADGVIYLSSVRPKTTERSTKEFRVAVNFCGGARLESERLLVNQTDDVSDVFMRIKGEINWINHKRGPNPVINVNWFRICDEPVWD